MSFGLARGRDLDPSGVAVTAEELPPLPDSIGTDPNAGRLDPRRWFPESDRPLEIEIGSGKGTFLLEQAAAEPGTNYLGLEWAGEFFAYAADRVRRRGLANVRMARVDGAEFLRWRCPPPPGAAVVRAIHLYFSDPWPKKRHHKNRVVQHRFLADAWRVLMPGGELRVATDHDELWAWDLDRFGVWTDAAAFEAWREAGSPDADGRVSDTALPPRTAVAPFALRPFQPVPWVGEGMLVGTNYERKMCAGPTAPKSPHATTLVKQVA